MITPPLVLAGPDEVARTVAALTDNRRRARPARAPGDLAVVGIDRDEARRWFEKAASQGHEAAPPRLAALARLQGQPPRAGTGS